MKLTTDTLLPTTVDGLKDMCNILAKAYFREILNVGLKMISVEDSQERIRLYMELCRLEFSNRDVREKQEVLDELIDSFENEGIFSRENVINNILEEIELRNIFRYVILVNEENGDNIWDGAVNSITESLKHDMRYILGTTDNISFNLADVVGKCEDVYAILEKYDR